MVTGEDKRVDALGQIDETPLGRIYADLSTYYYVRGRPDLAIRYGGQCLALVHGPTSPSLRAARQCLGTSYHVLGEYRMADEILTEHVAALEDDDQRLRVGPDNLGYVSSASWLAFTCIERGEFARAHEVASRARDAATTAGDPDARAIASAFTGFAWHAQGDVERALPAFEASYHLCVEHRLEAWRPVAGAMLGHAFVVLGKVDRGLELLSESTALTERLGVQAYRALWITLLADALLVNGQALQAVDVAERAVLLATQNKEQGNHTRALQVLGRAATQLGPSECERANEHLRQALEQAEQLGMRPVLAGCYHALGTLAGRLGDANRGESFLETARTLAREIGMRFWWEHR
jgi:tetratricopeptide (TPR) repeat protein